MQLRYLRLEIFLTFSLGFRIFEAQFLIKLFIIKKKACILELFTEKKPLRNLAKFQGGVFGLETLEIFTKVFFMKN